MSKLHLPVCKVPGPEIDRNTNFAYKTLSKHTHLTFGLHFHHILHPYFSLMCNLTTVRMVLIDKLQVKASSTKWTEKEGVNGSTALTMSVIWQLILKQWLYSLSAFLITLLPCKQRKSWGKTNSNTRNMKTKINFKTILTLITGCTEREALRLWSC